MAPLQDLCKGGCNKQVNNRYGLCRKCRVNPCRGCGKPRTNAPLDAAYCPECFIAIDRDIKWDGLRVWSGLDGERKRKRAKKERA